MTIGRGMLKVLVADDSETDRWLIQRMLRELDCEYYAVASGEALLELYSEVKPDIVLLDVLMPHMDGLETARRVKALAGDYFVPVIFLTSLQESEFIEQCLDAGGDDFISKPVNLKILRAKLAAFGRVQAMQNSLVAHRNQLRSHHDQLLTEQSVAKYVYDAITGKGSLDCGTIRYHMSSYALFNGDVLLASIRPNGNLMVLLGDFTGHGLPAALGAMPLASSFYSMIATGFSQTDIITELNTKMHAMLPRGFFCCAVCLELDFSRRQLSVWNGGLPTGYFISDHGQQLTELPSTALPLGVEVDDKFSSQCQLYEFNEDDRLVLWTDGIYDMRNAQGQRFSQERVLKLIDENRANGLDNLYDRLLNAVEHHLGNDRASDDLSLVEVLTQPPTAELGSSLQGGSAKGPLDWKLEFEINAPTFQSLDPIPVLMTLLSQVPGLGSKATSLFTVLSELYSNALDHGLLGLSSLDKDSGQGFDVYYAERNRRLQALDAGYIRFQLHLTTHNHSGRLELVVEDSGPGFEFGSPRPEVEQLLYGRGIDMVRQFCQSLTYEGRGNIARAIYVWPLDSY
ncbi:fused response regulator/phosphatase [Halioxenophilus sp. WMMB6]|uniref:ATP-binding SpoIIE family protein phosphatase n=1 Tax=Halioxenophilus sp. WMMB6 TaxID=3073815 RepID=UPI00295E2B8E|nr:fused response regulator/phosphatase [Halioxenophilus sp. WMMB6]